MEAINAVYINKILILIKHGDCSDRVYNSISLTMAYPGPVFQEKLEMLLFAHFAMYQYIYTVFTNNELAITSQ